MPTYRARLKRLSETKSHVMSRIMKSLSAETSSESDPVSNHPSLADVARGGSSDSNAAEGSSSEESRNPTMSQDYEAKCKVNGIGSRVAKGSKEDTAAPLRTANIASHPRALKVLFLSSDTGGGHRASATSLAQQFQNLFPGSSYALCDIVQLDGPPPYNMLVRTYKHLSAHPQQWKLVYNVSNTRAYEMLADVHMKSAMERSVRRRIRGYDPDVVVSVHPLMTNVPVLACRNISRETGNNLPIFTVCTDLGSAHSFWFANGVEKLFVASDAIRELAVQRGKVPVEKIVMSGLPIRQDFAVQATKLAGRHTPEGNIYQRFVRQQLGLKYYGDRKTVLVMGGGEGCGRLSNIVDALYLQFVERGMEALILVVCGRNEALKDSLSERDWEGMREKYLLARSGGADFESCVGLLSDMGCIGGGEGGVAGHIRRIISAPSMGMVMGTRGGNGPFRPIRGGVYEDIATTAVSMPSSRSGSPAPLDENDGDDNVEVITKSCAERNDLYSLNSLLHPLDSTDEAVMTGKSKSPAVAPQHMSASSNSIQDMMELRNENSLIEPQVKVTGLGFIANMAEYMVAADVLVSKAGPGTIAEAASLSLPVMLTSFLPGQEEGNVDYVVEGDFGAYCSEADPQAISEVVSGWLLDEDKLRELSNNAHRRGAPNAAAEIVEAIGESALRWKSHHIQEGEVGACTIDVALSPS